MSETPLHSIAPMSPLLLCHRLLELAEMADRAGLRRSASDLVEMAQNVCGERRDRRNRPASVSAADTTAPAIGAATVPASALARPPLPLPTNVTRLVTAAA